MPLLESRSSEALRDRLQQVYRRRGADLFSFAFRLTGSMGAAEDVVHESVLRVLDGRCRLDVRRGDLELLLFGVVRNVAREQSRALAREVRREPLDRPTAPDVPEHVLAVQSALRALSDTDREVIVLSAYHGHSPREIAVILGSTSLVIRVRLHRARARLRRTLLAQPSPAANAPARIGSRP